jgi:hypothetical protein
MLAITLTESTQLSIIHLAVRLKRAASCLCKLQVFPAMLL